MPSTDKAVSLLNVGSFTFLGHLVQENSFGGGTSCSSTIIHIIFWGPFGFGVVGRCNTIPLDPSHASFLHMGKALFGGPTKIFM